MSEERTIASKQIEYLHPVLVEFGFERNDLGSEDGVEIDRGAGGAITLLPTTGDLRSAICRFTAGENAKKKDASPDSVDDDNEIIFEVSAAYLVAVRVADDVSDDKLKAALYNIGVSGAWQLYRTLFALIANQATFDVPALPPIVELEWLDDVHLPTEEQGGTNDVSS